MVNLLLDLSFATNVRYLDEQEIYLSDNIELTKTLPFASGVAMARGVLDSLMSATYFNASALKLLRLIVTGGANIDLEKSLAEGRTGQFYCKTEIIFSKIYFRYSDNCAPIHTNTPFTKVLH